LFKTLFPPPLNQKMFSKSTLSLLLASLATSVYADAASPQAIALVKQQFVNALITPAAVPVFDPSYLLNFTFPTLGPISTGQAVSMADAATEPTITILGTDAAFSTGGNLNNAHRYTLIMIDANYAGSSNPNGLNTHYLQNDLMFGGDNDDVLTLSGTTAPVIKYAGPGPAAGSGAHRYTLLFFAQPTNFVAPSTPAAGSSVTMIDFPTYLKNANLGNPLAGNYFTVEVGTSTVTASVTSSVDPATLSVASASNTASGSSASASTAAKSSGYRFGLEGSVAMIVVAAIAVVAF